MPRNTIRFYSLVLLMMLTPFQALRAQDKPITVQAHWDKVVRVSQTVPTYLLGAGPPDARESPLHDKTFQALKDLGADDVRFAGGGYVYPHYGVVEMAAPTATA